MKLLKEFFREKPIILHKSEKLGILSMICVISFFFLISGYAIVFDMDFKGFAVFMAGIGFLIIGFVFPIMTFASFAGYGIMKEEIQELEAKKH